MSDNRPAIQPGLYWAVAPSTEIDNPYCVVIRVDAATIDRIEEAVREMDDEEQSLTVFAGDVFWFDSVPDGLPSTPSVGEIAPVSDALFQQLVQSPKSDEVTGGEIAVGIHGDAVRVCVTGQCVFTGHCIRSAELCSFTRTRSLWANDEIQFARMIAELDQLGAFTPEVVASLCTVTDLPEPDLMNVIERAQRRWDASVASVPAPQLHAAPRTVAPRP